MKLSNAEIQQGIAELPDNIRQAVLDFDWADEIMAIGHEHRMHMDDIDLFRQQTLAVILGKSPADKYELNLMHEIGLSKDIADIIVEKANTRIFRELQHRAFEQKKQDIINEDEVLEHHEIKNVFADEGIHLIDEDEVSSLDTDLHKEVAEIMSSVEKVDTPSINLINNTASSSITTKNTITPAIIEKNKIDLKTNYQEAINDKDLKGIGGHRIDTSVINQTNPESILNNTSSFMGGRDLGQGNYTPNQRLDEKKISEMHISQVDSSQVIETTTSTENFLDKLSEE